MALLEVLSVRRSSGVRKRPVHFNTIALRFPKADKAFKEIRKTFEKFDEDQSNSIELDELRQCLKELKVNITDEEVLTFFNEADMDCSNGVQFKEFILLMALVYFLKPPDEGQSRFGSPNVEAAFLMIEDAFSFFDEDGDGFLTRQEISRALTSKKDPVGSFAKNRFAEMDYDTDGHCSFKEFLYAYVGWVGTAEEDEDDA